MQLPLQATPAWQRMQRERCAYWGLSVPEPEPADWAATWRAILAQCGGTDGPFWDAWADYLPGEFAGHLDRKASAAVFIKPKVWGTSADRAAAAKAQSAAQAAAKAARAAEARAWAKQVAAEEAARWGEREKAEAVWQQALDRLRAEGKTYALTWLDRVCPLGLREGVLGLGVPDRFLRDWVDDQYGSLLRSVLASEVRDFELVVVATQSAAS